MRTKKKMQTKKKEGNEFSLMKFVQMARVGFRNCHTRWFSKKKILGPVMYICSQFCPSFLQKTPTFCISQKKVPYGFFFHLAFGLRSQPQILSNCANLFYLLTYFYNTLQQNDSKMRQCIYIKRELLFQCSCISIIVIFLINFIGPPLAHTATIPHFGMTLMI